MNHEQSKRSGLAEAGKCLEFPLRYLIAQLTPKDLEKQQTQNQRKQYREKQERFNEGNIRRK